MVGRPRPCLGRQVDPGKLGFIGNAYFFFYVHLCKPKLDQRKNRQCGRDFYGVVTRNLLRDSVYSLGDRFVSLRSRGLGVLDLQTINLALMVKWWWILLSKTNGTLQVTIRTKYGQGWDPSLENQEIARTYRILGKT